jgi:predicted enzyme related to lactoylglutathione lyase
VGWHELHADDLDSAWAFYAAQFGWTRDQAIDMGPAGTYQLFATGGPAVGGMMTKTPDMPAPMWLYYFNVDGVDAAVARVTQGGGQLLFGPEQVPGGSWIVQCTDPQGAMFALVGMRR